MEIPVQPFAFHLEDSPFRIAVESFHAEEGISQPFQVNLVLVSEERIGSDDIIQQAGTLTVAGKDQDRFFNGLISNFMMLSQTGRFFTYQATLVPSIAMMDLNKAFRIYQEKTIAEIVEKLLKENGLTGDCYDFRLVGKYENRRYCTQYGESDLRFLSRILEEEGIFYFFEHSEDSHKIIFADSNMTYQPIAGASEIGLHHDAGLVPDEEVIADLSYHRMATPDKVIHTNYNFKRPSLDMAVVEKVNNDSEREIYEYPGDYGLPSEGQRKARARLEEKRALEQNAQGTSNCARFVPGYTFSVCGNPFDHANKSYLLISVNHSGSQPNVYGENSGIGGDYSYSNSFLAIPSTVPYRPERTLEKPFVKSLVTAIVTGPPGEEIYVDEYGRVKVRFHWDREGQNEKSSCWLRFSQPWSGLSWGMICLPRVGDEVIVGFINGDPDWPIILGSVNNAQSPALYPLPGNKTRSGIRTRSYPKGGRDNYHELRFEDKKGMEEIYLRSERDWNILVKNDKKQEVLHDEMRQVGHNRTKLVAQDQMEHIGRNDSETIVANKSVSVGGNKNETVALNSAESVGLAKELSVGGIYQVSVACAMNETVLGGKSEEVGLAKSVLVSEHMTEMVRRNRSITVGENLSATVTLTTTIKAKTIILDADDELILKSGNAVISLKQGEIRINGTTCTEQATGEIVIKGARTSVN